MNEQKHISVSELIDWAAGNTDTEHLAAINEHLSTCDECANQATALVHFNRTLDETWHAERLLAMGMAHPTAAELEMFWMNEDSPNRDTVAEHIASCESCTQHVERLKEGFAALDGMDPFAGPRWAGTISRQFAAGIEMVVEAARGAFTSAAGLVREVMPPQTSTRLVPTPVIAMGGGGEHADGSLWHDATFGADEVSGEISGSTDNTTGRGIITIIVNKTGEFVGRPPMVDLVDAGGAVVATQSGLDMGDRYITSFSGLDEGHYLVGVREPGE